MEISQKLKETALSVAPISAAVLALGLTVARMPLPFIAWFLAGSALVVVGLTVFLMGVELGVSRIGERCGAALTERRSLWLLVAAALLIGVTVTAAEPDIQVFADQVAQGFAGVGKAGIVASIAAGVGLFLAGGILRMVVGVRLKAALGIGYAAILGMMALAPQPFVGVAFDAGGATTGPLTVPFIMALGLGVSTVRGGRDGGFGLTGIASVGPVAAMLAYAVFTGGGTAAAAGASEGAHAAGLDLAALAGVAREVLVSTIPLCAIALVLQLFLLRMTRRQFARAMVGFALAAVGLFIFLSGVHCGFMEAGRAVGRSLGERMQGGGASWCAASALIAFSLGAVVVCAEPAVWILGEQVEHVSGGMIGRKALLAFLAAATAMAVAAACLRSAFGFPLWLLLVPGYLLAIAMMPFTPGIFTGMAFDSGGVASGPLTTAFVLPFTVGVAEGCGRAGDTFGVIALVAMMPLVAIQAMGIAMEARRRGASGGKGK